MPTSRQTIEKAVSAPTWDQRVAQIRLIAQNHAPAETSAIYAEIARQAYVPYLAPDFAYVHYSPFYSRETFVEAYNFVDAETNGFTNVSEDRLTGALLENSRSLLVLRTILGLTRDEFAHSTALLAPSMGVAKLNGGRVGGIEQNGSPVSADQARLIARTLTQIIDGTLFGGPPADNVQTKQAAKIDTAEGWVSVESMHRLGVSYVDLLHQRHYGGAFRQVTDATSTARGNLVEDAVEALFIENGIQFLRTGSHDQGEIEARFEISVRPAPDFVVYDGSETLRAMLECKLVSDGGTARDKALRFGTLRQEATRLGGVPLLAVLGGMGWARVNDTLGPVVQNTDGRVFTLATLDEMMTVAPFPSLINRAG